MQEQHLFEYAVIRLVPRVEREEFLNTGVIVFCKRPPFLQTMIVVNEAKLLALFPEADIAAIREHLEAFEAISKGISTDSPIAALDIASRFRWLTAKRSTVVQTSAVHSGLCSNPEKTVQHLLEQLVL
ncbi:MAG: DUF3037 domain-containing protein [Ferruginibacter sp.]